MTIVITFFEDLQNEYNYVTNEQRKDFTLKYIHLDRFVYKVMNGDNKDVCIIY